MTLDQQLSHIARLGQLWDAAYAALSRRDLDGFDKHMSEFHRLNVSRKDIAA